MLFRKGLTSLCESESNGGETASFSMSFTVQQILYRTPASGSAKNNLKIRCRNFRKTFFSKIYFCKVKKRILENIFRIWHLLKGNLPKVIIIWHKMSNLTPGYGSVIHVLCVLPCLIIAHDILK
jgi:hypothetical protein